MLSGMYSIKRRKEEIVYTVIFRLQIVQFPNFTSPKKKKNSN